jgi:ATP-dependent protease ClpP protease subunit
MGSEDRDSAASPEKQRDSSEGSTDQLSDPSASPVDFPKQSPLFYAQHSERYERQRLIRQYQECFNCRLVVLVDLIFPDSITLLEELIAEADPDKDLHLLLDTPGGDGETAVRLARSAQARCRELTIIVPNQAKSAGTLLAMGAHHIFMGPTSDLGPVDPQFPSPEGGPDDLYSAKDLIAAVENAEASIAAQPDTYPLHVSLLAKVNAVMVQQARSALDRSGDLVREALRSQPDRSEEDVEAVACAVQEKLIDLPKEHGAVFDARDAEKAGLPVIHADPRSDQWRLIWLLWTKYFNLDAYVAEGEYASQIMPRSALSQSRESDE